MAYCANTSHILVVVDSRITTTSLCYVGEIIICRQNLSLNCSVSISGIFSHTMSAAIQGQQNHMIDRGPYEAIKRLIYSKLKDERYELFVR